DLSRVSAKERRVRRPRGGRRLVECAADREEQLRGLAHDLVEPVDRRPRNDDEREAGGDPGAPWPSSKAAVRAPACRAARQETFRGARQLREQAPRRLHQPPCNASEKTRDAAAPAKQLPQRPTRTAASRLAARSGSSPAAGGRPSALAGSSRHSASLPAPQRSVARHGGYSSAAPLAVAGRHKD